MRHGASLTCITVSIIQILAFADLLGPRLAAAVELSKLARRCRTRNEKACSELVTAAPDDLDSAVRVAAAGKITGPVLPLRLAKDTKDIQLRVPLSGYHWSNVTKPFRGFYED